MFSSNHLSASIDGIKGKQMFRNGIELEYRNFCLFWNLSLFVDETETLSVFNRKSFSPFLLSILRFKIGEWTKWEKGNENIIKNR